MNAITKNITFTNNGRIDIEDLPKIIDIFSKLKRDGIKNSISVYNDDIYSASFDENGAITDLRNVIPDILGVEVINDNDKPVAVKVYFADGSFTKSIVHKDDTFSIENGISVCITKKLLGDDGTAVYNKLISYALRVKKNNEDLVKLLENQEESERKKHEKIINKKRKHREKIEAAKREERINEQKEAYIRALIEFQKINSKETEKAIENLVGFISDCAN